MIKIIKAIFIWVKIALKVCVLQKTTNTTNKIKYIFYSSF